MFGKMAIALAFGCTVSLIGCATIVGDTTQLIPIASTPSEATIGITDENNVEIFKGKTPSNVTLRKSDGNYWGKKSYTVTITKDGFETRKFQLTASPNGWYLAGNIVFGGLIGWFIVDPFNGAMYTLSPKNISQTLTEKTASRATDRRISILLLQDVPPSLRKEMRRVN
jgi:hypothetical protein